MEKILISACLLGQNCRYDGQSKTYEPIQQLMNRQDILLIPICPEQAGGLATPRDPAERQGQQVVTCNGKNVTQQYHQGARQALRLAKLYGCKRAILKEKSPSCGHGKIYDGTFTRTLTRGNGVTAELLEKEGIKIIGETQVEAVSR
jgi:uncharacterized protein YbbK (DUF523 family)